MKFTIKEPRRGQDQDPNQSNRSPTSAQLLTCTASSDQRPAAGQVTGDAPVASYQSRDSMTSEVEFQRQLALGSSSSNLEFCGDDLENYQIRAAIQLSLGGHWRGDAGRKKDEVLAKTQSEQYWKYDVIDYEENVTDGFYDAHNISTDSRLQGKMPSLTDLQTVPGSSGFEAIIVNHRTDHALEDLVQIAQCIGLNSSATEVTVLVQRLAELVTGHMGGPVEDANIMWARWMERSTQLRTSLQTSVLPIGSINVGLSRHRALLFKVLADSINLPCRLVKGCHYTGLDDDAVNVIKLDNQREFLVDLMAAPGTLIPASSCSGKDNKPYGGKISKLPSFQSPDGLGVVHSRPKPAAGEGSSQSLAMETDPYVDGNLNSKMSESFPAFPFASNKPGVGSSRVSGRTAQQLNVNEVPQSKNSSKDSTNLFADLNPFAIKGFCKAPMEGNSTEMKIDEMPRQKYNPVPDRHPVLLMPKNQNSPNEEPRKKDYGLKEGLFLRSNRVPNSYYVSSFTGISTADKVNPDRISGGIAQELNIDVVPQSKNSSEKPTNLSADLNPFDIKGFRKAPMEGKSTEIKNNEMPRQKNNPLPDRPPGPLMPKNQHLLNAVPRKKDYGFKEGLFSRSNREPNADHVSSSIGRSTTHKVKLNSVHLNAQVRKDPLRTLEILQDGVADSQTGRDRHEIGLSGLKKWTNDRFMDTNFVSKDSESPSSSIDNNTIKVDRARDDVDVGVEIHWEHLIICERIGRGSYGEVYRADWNSTEVAVKKIWDQDFSGASLDEFRREVRIMRGLHHPNIVLFKGAVARPPHLSIIMEFLPRGSLYRIIHHPHCHIDEKLRIKMALDVARGMNCLHTSVPTIVHRDLKSPNLLVDQNWNVKVCDFGLSRLKHNTFLSSKSTGTPEWMAPEVLRNEPSNEKCMTSRRDTPDAGLWRTAVEGFNRIVFDDASRLKMNSGPDASISRQARVRFWKEVADVYEVFLVGCCGRALPTDNLPAAAVKADESLEMTVLNILGDNILKSPIDASADILQRLVSTLDRCASRTCTLPIDTVELMPIHSSRFSLTCLEKLFSLTSYDSEACNWNSVTSDISKISVMVLMARCEYILNRFLIDENDLGERPLPKARLEEMIYVLQQLARLVIHKETVCDLPLHPHLRRGLRPDDEYNRRAHLLVLFPSFCELVASRESRVRELVQVLLRLIAEELALGKFQALTGLSLQ